MKHLWRIRRLFLRRDIRELIDRYHDDQEYFAPDVVGIGKVTKKTISDAQSQGLVKRNTRNTEFGKMRVISLTKKKGLPLSQAKYIPNWEKIAALVGIATLIFTLLAFAYQIYTANSMVTSSYTFAYTEPVQNSDKLKEAECWEGITGRSDEFRCTRENSIYTPCFMNFYDNDFIKCPRNPHNDQESVYFKLKDIRGKPIANSETEKLRPWFIKLSNGVECGFLTGATNTIANRRLDFGCNDKKTTLYLPVEQVKDSTYVGCLINHRVEKCLIGEIWY